MEAEQKLPGPNIGRLRWRVAQIGVESQSRARARGPSHSEQTAANPIGALAEKQVGNQRDDFDSPELEQIARVLEPLGMRRTTTSRLIQSTALERVRCVRIGNLRALARSREGSEPRELLTASVAHRG